MDELIQASIKIILQNQPESGAYLACPNFPTYHYSWFRDGSFIAYAMTLAGERKSAERFYDWVASTIRARKAVIQRAVFKANMGILLAPVDVLHTRYTAEGEDGTTQEWPNFQLDGFGTWLWAIAEYQKESNEGLAPAWKEAASWIGEYLEALWQHPCYDCWEEYPQEIHTHTLAAMYAGFMALESLGISGYTETAQAVKDYIMQHCVYDGYFVKFAGSYTVDASLLGLAVPYQVVALDDPRMIETVNRIRASLIRGGGVHRYPTDTYYGGGEWVLLTAWLGWYEAMKGDVNLAYERLNWIKSQANKDLELPEQVPASMVDANNYQPWIKRWGEVASPLLWSHAKLMILYHTLNKK
jgi:GH15 family glucan-1,4-alpha-glucosidase